MKFILAIQTPHQTMQQVVHTSVSPLLLCELSDIY